MNHSLPPPFNWSGAAHQARACDALNLALARRGAASLLVRVAPSGLYSELWLRVATPHEGISHLIRLAGMPIVAKLAELLNTRPRPILADETKLQIAEGLAPSLHSSKRKPTANHSTRKDDA